MKNVLRLVLAKVLQFKKWCYRNIEYVLHFVLTDLLVTAVLLVFFVTQRMDLSLLAVGIGFFANAIPEVCIPGFNMKDIYAGTLGAVSAYFRFYLILLILSIFKFYSF